MKKYIYILTLAVAAIALTSCEENGFLDKNPDARAEINSKKKVQLLLVSGYDIANMGPLCETSSDNIIDNNTPDAVGHVNHKEPSDKMYHQIFAWEAVTTNNQQDSPYAIWQGCYHNIAVANQALLAIEEIEKNDPTVDLGSERAEALLIRAFNHFILVNVFAQAYKNDETSAQDAGIHYMHDVETSVKPVYKRHSVTEVYHFIEEDLEKALETVSDDYYNVPKYHFNVKAAHAFAARFYLYMRQWDKVIEHANKVVGTTRAEAEQSMFDAKAAKKLGNGEEEMHAWFDAKSPANLLITSTNSVALWMFITDYARYTFNRAPEDLTVMGPGPNWDNRFPGCNVWQYNSNFGGFMATLIAAWEYTDKVAGIGYPHNLRREFTSGETLLCRAEAEIMTGKKEAAIEDMDIWTKGYCCTKDLTETNIKSFFRKGKTAQLTPVLHTNDMSSDWTVTDDQLPLIWCVLHFRRIETLHFGYRWLDIKRYGIELTHEIGYPVVTKTLIWNDDRRALQIPQEAILAGHEANPRLVLGDMENTPMSTAAPEKNDLERFLELKAEKPVLIPFDVE